MNGKTEKKSGTFWIRIFRKKLPLLSAKKVHGLLLPEIFALTLASNRTIGRVLKYAEQYVEGGLHLPAHETVPDNWINYWASDGASGGHATLPANKRSALLGDILGAADTVDDSTKPVPRSPARWHVSVRAYPIRYSSPQSPKDTAMTRLLLVGYDLSKHRLYVQIAPLRFPYKDKPLSTLVLHEDLIPARQWTEFVSKVQSMAMSDTGDVSSEVCLHVPHGSRLVYALKNDDCRVLDDMPAESGTTDRFEVHVTKRSIKGLAINYIDLSDTVSKPQAILKEPALSD